VMPLASRNESVLFKHFHDSRWNPVLVGHLFVPLLVG
jgi:hypothetical protein